VRLPLTLSAVVSHDGADSENHMLLKRRKRPVRPVPPVNSYWYQLIREASTRADWDKLAKSAVGSLLVAGLMGGAAVMLVRELAAASRPSKDAEAEFIADANEVDELKDEAATVEEEQEQQPCGADKPSARPEPDRRVVEAAAMLGITPDASEDEIRAALRALLSSSKLHPDHGGDGVEAKRLIAAKNLLIEHAKLAREAVCR
jgi:hypothetical protein